MIPSILTAIDLVKKNHFHPDAVVLDIRFRPSPDFDGSNRDIAWSFTCLWYEPRGLWHTHAGGIRKTNDTWTVHFDHGHYAFTTLKDATYDFNKRTP
jgi:hypothetical protein